MTTFPGAKGHQGFVTPFTVVGLRPVADGHDVRDWVQIASMHLFVCCKHDTNVWRTFRFFVMDVFDRDTRENFQVWA